MKVINVQLLGQHDYSKHVSDIWGYEADSGIEYAIMGVFDGTVIIDTTTEMAVYEYKIVEN